MGDHHGHVFVVHGRSESVVHDAAVVPTDDVFGIEPHWARVVGCDDLGALRPPGWPGPGHGRAADGRPVWFVSVGTDAGLPTEELVGRARAVVREVAGARLEGVGGRGVPVLALPVLGVEGGGHDRDRGDVVRALLRAAHEETQDLALDVAVVTPETSVHGAAQHVRARLDGTAPLAGPGGSASDPDAEARRLGALARSGDLALFLGAGVSRSAGLPSWREMLAMLGRRTGRLDAEEARSLTLLDQAQLLERRVPDLGEHVAAICREHGRPSLAHTLLASLECREVVTTNYDDLYERAVLADGMPAPAVLPWQSPVGVGAWVLKLHGDQRHPASIVLTRRDFVRFDAGARPAGSLLQALLLTRHLLVVGASMTDDNVVRLAEEASVYREEHGATGEVGTVLDVEGDPARGELWEDHLRWLTMPGESLAERIRSLEVFLDTVARHAADDASWVLDPRFAGLLDDETRALADEVRRLRGRVSRAGQEWSPLLDTLDALGADPHAL
jgi:hypothetical protein